MKPGLCAAFGDPHFITFDGGHTVLFGERTLWLVRSEEVWVQAWSRASQGRLVALAIGGPFIQGHTVILYKTTPSFFEVLYDGKSILSKANSTFQVPGVLDGFKSTVWQAGLHNSDILNVRTELKFDIGPWPERFLGQPKGGVLLLRFPQGVEITATGVNFMSAVVTMNAQAGGQGGYCGNFNGKAEDDMEPLGPSFNLPVGPDLDPPEEDENLFRMAGAVDAILGSVIDDKVRIAGGAPDPLDAVRNCDLDLRKKAVQRCTNVPDTRMQSDCVIDVCVTGTLRAADDAIAAQVLEEKVNPRGIPTFRGLGRCLDTAGRPYGGYGTEAKTEGECQDLLRGLALNRGVVGAQLRVGGACQVLVDAAGGSGSTLPPAAADTAVRPDGGRLEGQGLIASTSSEEGWKCWQLA